MNIEKKGSHQSFKSVQSWEEYTLQIGHSTSFKNIFSERDEWMAQIMRSAGDLYETLSNEYDLKNHASYSVCQSC